MQERPLAVIQTSLQNQLSQFVAEYSFLLWLIQSCSFLFLLCILHRSTVGFCCCCCCCYCCCFGGGVVFVVCFVVFCYIFLPEFKLKGQPVRGPLLVLQENKRERIMVLLPEVTHFIPLPGHQTKQVLQRRTVCLVTQSC